MIARKIKLTTARASLTTAGLLLLMKVNVVRHNLLLPVQVNVVEANFAVFAKVEICFNEEKQLQALVDRKKVIITESTIRRDLQLEDAEGMDYLPTATIFEELTRMSAKTTAWNEFSSTMAFEIICLATNQKFNFSKYIFDNVDSMGKFWMYPSIKGAFGLQMGLELNLNMDPVNTSLHTIDHESELERRKKD
ncbi:hypothetical protein Tco_0902275 [Tanacetum coccineum]